MNGYELLDCGNGKKLERFGGALVIRPAPTAIWAPRRPRAWGAADAEFVRPGRGQVAWRGTENLPTPWRLECDGFTLELRPAAGGQVGVFPEQQENWTWLARAVAAAPRPLRILNAFAYTGAATLALAAVATTEPPVPAATLAPPWAAAGGGNPGLELVHLDGAKANVAWAKRNARASGLAAAPIRWLTDDVAAFLRRELRRGNRYDGIVLDPPAFGRGGGREWRIERDLTGLLALVKQALTAAPRFVLLTLHAADLGPGALDAALRPLLAGRGGRVEAGAMIIPTPGGGHPLPAGTYARWSADR